MSALGLQPERRLSSRAKRGILVLTCGDDTRIAGKNQDPSLRSG
jgi:hypothetical protein